MPLASFSCTCLESKGKGGVFNGGKRLRLIVPVWNLNSFYVDYDTHNDETFNCTSLEFKLEEKKYQMKVARII